MGDRPGRARAGGAFLLGLLQRRLYAAGALQQLGAAARGALDREKLREVLADTVGDPTLEVVYRGDSPPRWLDAQGHLWMPPPPGSGRCLTEVREDRRLVAGLVHDDALLDQTDFLRAVASYALTALENRRLTAQVESSLREVRQSRTRIQASGDRERRRIERDLHDGAQQRLVALGIQLELTEDLIRQDRERGLERLHAWAARWTRRWRRSRRWDAGCTRRCWRTAAWPRPCVRPRGGCRWRPR